MTTCCKFIQIIILVLFGGAYKISFAQTAVETIEVMGKTYTVTKNFPKEILGKYLYEGKGDPIVLLNENGEGLFQAHQVPPIKIKFWIDCDENGIVRKQEGVQGRYQYTLLIQYAESSGRAYVAGQYNLMGVAVLKDLGRAVIYGERYKPLD